MRTKSPDKVLKSRCFSRQSGAICIAEGMTAAASSFGHLVHLTLHHLIS